MTCNYCGSKEFDIVAEYTRFEQRHVLRCQNCGLVFLEIKSSKSEVEQYYSSEYRKSPTLPVQSAEEHFNDKVTQYDADNRIKFIMENVDVRNQKILEIGCASGSLLQKLRDNGCREAAGVEIGLEYADYAQQLGFNVYTRPIEELGFKEEFDAVVSFHTLEHVYDPKAVIRAVSAALKPGGHFLGEVPNQNDWRIAIFDDEVVKRFHYDPNHLFYYSPATLTKYLETGSFSNIKLESVERYNSLVQLRNILCDRNESVEDILRKYIFPRSEKDEVRLPRTDDAIGRKFNRIFAKAVNSELMGNCLRWVATRGN